MMCIRDVKRYLQERQRLIRDQKMYGMHESELVEPRGLYEWSRKGEEGDDIE